ncbi:flagellin [Trichlorobacter lovleyi]|uniref:flagellin N-terminal helical domain-containing protein n=1 Tax=Trichlorobacter lovleyi TaxID=313985 RepID=UPI00223F4236|nr:flagellin [Trichlorobacter lovleyi]QOX80344.1 flagellin [Trichlorobacter lovleyi]
MAMGDISLTAGMRSNLLSLQTTTGLIDKTQTRLSTGKKVNTPLDNPTNFFAAQGHVTRANDLSVRKDGMAEAIQMVTAADTGIKGISSLIQAAQGVAGAALATSDVNERSSYSSTFSTLLNQISMMASDSGYRGTNLLTGGSQTVEFGQRTNSSTLQINGFDATATGLTTKSATAEAWSVSGNSAINSSSSELESALSFLRAKSSTLSASLSAVTTRQDFTSNMINTLKIGADNITLADTNEEGANMLMLQTRQNLGITSLSMASQSAQAVMRLF